MAKLKQRNLPDTDHAARYCPFVTLLSDGSVSGTAFCLKIGEEYLSINWLEVIKKNGLSNQLRMVRKIWAKKNLKGKGSKIARLNVGKSKKCVEDGTSKSRSVNFDPVNNSV